MLPEGFLEDLANRAGPAMETPIVFSDEELRSLSGDDADEIGAAFNGQAMMRLPEWDVRFFEWVKARDMAAWEDLWLGETEPYVVGVAFLPAFIEQGYGFPICDLVVQDNFYFHKDFVCNPDGTNMVGIIVEKVGKNEKLEMNEVFLLEVMQHPIDIWRFAYKYSVDLQDAKMMALAYADDGVILHLKKSEEIADYIEL